MEDCAPFVFFISWAPMAPYLCFSFHIFNRFILEEYVSQVERDPHLLQSCFRVAQGGLPLATKEMHLSFESLTITGALNLQASLMDIHHDTFFKSILKHDSISSTSRIRIHSCSGKETGLWLIYRPSICSFHIAHSTFTSALHFCLI